MYSIRPTRERILRRYRDCARKLGRPPGELVFSKMAGISRPHIAYYWPRISDLSLEACGARNDYKSGLPDAELFAEYARLCLHLKKIPARSEMRIATRELGTRTGGAPNRFGTGAEFHRRFRDWLEQSSGDGSAGAEGSARGEGNVELRAILSYPGWERPEGPKPVPPPLPTKWSRAFLPIGLQYLDELAQGEGPPYMVSDEPAYTLFERGCAEAFSALGFYDRRIGLAKAIAPRLWTARPYDYGVILQTKLRRHGEALNADNPAFPGFIASLALQLEKDGIGKSYLAMISSEFDDGDLKRFSDAFSGSRIRGVALFFASALMRIVEESIRDRFRFHLGEFEKMLFGNGIVSA